MALILTGNCTSSENVSGNGQKEDLAGLSSMEFIHKMTAGWNLGNTLDAHWNAKPWGNVRTPRDQETLWGNPVTTRAVIDRVKASGFNTIRLPVTWYIFTGPGPDYKINDAWMNRVQEIVDYVINNNMFCILNTHHEDYQYGSDWEIGWLRLYYNNGNEHRPLNDAEKQEMKNRISKIWEQISERFKDYDEYLIFEALNEPRTIGLPENLGREVWAEQGAFLNDLLQTFVDTVRKSGGKNQQRHLMVSPFFASVGMDPRDRDGRIADFVDAAGKKLRINDEKNKLIASVHYYEPWGFVTAPSDSQYFSEKFDLNAASVSSNINNVLRIMEDSFIKNGIPVVMGETGAIHRDFPSHDAERAKWAEYYTSRLKELGIPVVIWDDGGSFKLLDRSRAEWLYPDIVSALVEGSKTAIKY